MLPFSIISNVNQKSYATVKITFTGQGNKSALKYARYSIEILYSGNSFSVEVIVIVYLR